MKRNKQLKIIQAVNTELSELERQRNVYFTKILAGMQRWNGETDVGRRKRPLRERLQLRQVRSGRSDDI